ncbi:MAG: ferritin-like domain-containing protein [Methyloligellaceae bacterium]
MLQYLYCAFSLREPYGDLAGHGAATADNMIGVAIQEMQHLSAVNRLLVALGSCPHLDRQDFPYEPDIYPFVFQLEPLSKVALAKYVYTEAPAEAFDVSLAKSAADTEFRSSVLALLGADHRTNHVGSLYRSILDVLGEVTSMPEAPITVDASAKWREELLRIMDEGEDDHFKFFRATFEAKHQAFGADQRAWSRDPTDPVYPAHPVGFNPTAYIGHPHQISEPSGLILGWLGDLHYWTTLSTLDYGYRVNDDEAIDHATMQMTSTIWPIAKILPSHNTGIPFDPLSMGYALGAGSPQTKRIIASFCKEALKFAEHIEHRLPEDYDTSATKELIRFLEA